MFESLSRRLQASIDRLRGRGRITEADLKEVLRDLRRALLEADVNYQVAKAFVKRVEEKALGRRVLESLTPAEQILAVVHEEMVELLGGRAVEPRLLAEGNLWFLIGLQGTGKTTAAAKLAHLYRKKGRRPLLVVADTQRPAAQDPLEILAEKVGVPVLRGAPGEPPASVKRRLYARRAEEFRDLVIVDTAGRLQVDEALMDELAALAEALSPTEKILVVDAMMGQEALAVAEAFDRRVGVTGLMLTKLDGDARGGAALSARHVTGKPIYFAGTSEKIDGLEVFHPDRLAGRILGMGDLATLAEKVREAELKAPEKAPGKFDLNDLLEQMRQIQKMGSFGELLKMIPGLARALPANLEVDERGLKRIEAIILSMTPEERRNPRVLNASRRRRIARGSGTTVQEINRLIKTFEETKALMKRLGKRGGRRSLMGGFGGRPW